MYRFEPLAKRLFRMLIVIGLVIAISASISYYLLYLLTNWLFEAGPIVRPIANLALVGLGYLTVVGAYTSFLAAWRFRAGLLMIAALRAAGDRRWCTEVELAEAARLRLDRARPILAWLVTYTYRGQPVVGQLECDGALKFILTPTGAPWADRLLRRVGGN